MEYSKPAEQMPIYLQNKYADTLRGLIDDVDSDGGLFTIISSYLEVGLLIEPDQLNDILIRYGYIASCYEQRQALLSVSIEKPTVSDANVMSVFVLGVIVGMSVAERVYDGAVACDLIYDKMQPYIVSHDESDTDEASPFTEYEIEVLTRAEIAGQVGVRTEHGLSLVGPAASLQIDQLVAKVTATQSQQKLFLAGFGLLIDDAYHAYKSNPDDIDPDYQA